MAPLYISWETSHGTLGAKLLRHCMLGAKLWRNCTFSGQRAPSRLPMTNILREILTDLCLCSTYAAVLSNKIVNRKDDNK